MTWRAYERHSSTPSRTTSLAHFPPLGTTHKRSTPRRPPPTTVMRKPARRLLLDPDRRIALPTRIHTLSISSRSRQLSHPLRPKNATIHESRPLTRPFPRSSCRGFSLSTSPCLRSTIFSFGTDMLFFGMECIQRYTTPRPCCSHIAVHIP